MIARPLGNPRAAQKRGGSLHAFRHSFVPATDQTPIPHQTPYNQAIAAQSARRITMPDTITVTIPAALRPQVEGQEAVTAQGETIGSVLDALKGQYPSFGEKLFPAGDATMNRSINVYINEEDIRFLDNLDTKVAERDQVDIILAIAGG